MSGRRAGAGAGPCALPQSRLARTFAAATVAVVSTTGGHVLAIG